jgi:hypothetical protein
VVHASGVEPPEVEIVLFRILEHLTEALHERERASPVG